MMKSFTAGFTKWRFETIIFVVRSLLVVRAVARELKEEMFGDVQDRVLLQSTINACRDEKLWNWMEAAEKHILGTLEGVRRWAMVCPCCEDKRREGAKHLHCRNNSRRLHQVPEFMSRTVADIQARARYLTAAMCGGDNEVKRLIKGMMDSAADSLMRRWKYFYIVPWRFSEADTVSGALECCQQVLARPIEEHDPTTRDIWARLSVDITTRSPGGPVTPALKLQVRAIKTTPLDESCGEGWHRDSNHEKCRAPNSSDAHLKRHVRAKGVIKDLRRFCRKYGKEGKDIVRFELRNWKRILQTTWRHRFRRKKCGRFRW